jgi:hypothetical protein
MDGSRCGTIEVIIPRFGRKQFWHHQGTNSKIWKERVMTPLGYRFQDLEGRSCGTIEVVIPRLGRKELWHHHGTQAKIWNETVVAPSSH